MVNKSFVPYITVIHNYEAFKMWRNVRRIRQRRHYNEFSFLKYDAMVWDNLTKPTLFPNHWLKPAKNYGRRWPNLAKKGPMLLEIETSFGQFMFILLWIPNVILLTTTFAKFGTQRILLFAKEIKILKLFPFSSN